MKVSFLTSGFPDGFTDEFIKCIKEYYVNAGCIVFVASDFTSHSTTDKHVKIFLDMFKNNNIIFNEFHVVDDRLTQKESLQYIEKADIIWLSGGDTLMQIKYLKNYNLISFLQNRDGITIGMSAGSINMAKRVVLAKDMEDNIPELSIYDGIGLVDINIEPHLDSSSENHLNEIWEASQFSTIYGLNDNSFIKIVNNNIDIYGDYSIFKKISD